MTAQKYAEINRLRADKRKINDKTIPNPYRKTNKSDDPQIV